MNSNTTLPTIAMRDQETERYLCFDWTDGRNIPDSVTLQLAELHADPSVHADLVRNVERVLQHTYLMAYERGAVGAREARDAGYQRGGEEAPQPAAFYNDDECEAFFYGVNARRGDNEAGARIESLIAARVQVQYERDELRRQLDAVTAELATANELAESLHAERNEYARDAVEAREQRDVMAESVEQLAVSVRVPNVVPVEGGTAATIYRAESNFNVQQWVPAGYDRWTGEEIAANLRGALADAYHVGQEEMEAAYRPQVAQLETDLANAKIVVEQVQNDMEQRVRNMQARIDERDRDFAHAARSLMDEAERRSWCAEYEEWAKGCNSGMTHYQWELREKTYSVTVTVTMDLDYEEVDTRARELGFDSSYDVSTIQSQEADFYFSVECEANEIAEQAERLRAGIYRLSSVSEASVSWEESDS